MCFHRNHVLTPEELDYHIRVEGGLVVDAPDAPAAEAAGSSDTQVDSSNAVVQRNSDVREGIDALLSMARGAAVVPGSQVSGALDEEKTIVTGAATAGFQTTDADADADKQPNVIPTSAETAQNQTAEKQSTTGETTEREEPKDQEVKEEKDDDDEDLQLKVPQSSPLRSKYKLWIDPVSKKTRKLFPCEHCKNLFLTLAKLIRHMPTHTGVFPFLCPLCPSSFKTSHELTKHDKRKHRSTASTGFPGAQYQCQQCAVAYHTRNALERHINNHGNDSRQPRASYVLKRKASNNRLVRTYPCPHCPQEFHKAAEFEGHLASHTGIKLYICRLCDKRFGNEAYLKKHMLRHSLAKSYICALCGAAFKTSSGLYTHEHSVHIDTKDFVCEVCGKEFKMKWSMKEHLRMAHSDYVLPKGQTSNWQCSYCGGFLPSDIMFRIHEKLHITDKPFKCRLCPASFKYRAARLSHERREHEGVVQDPRLVIPRTPSQPVKRSADQQKSAPVRSIEETPSSQYMEGMYYPQHVPQHPLPPAQSFIQQHLLQQQQQNVPSPPDNSREPTPSHNLTSEVVASHPSVVSALISHYTSPPAHTSIPSDNYHGSSRVSTPNTFSHPEQSSTASNLQPVYSSSHILPAAAAAASVLYDTSYYMAAAAHLSPPQPALPSSSVPISLPPLSAPSSLPPLSAPSPALSTPAQPAHQPPPPPAPTAAPAQQPAADNPRSTPQPLPPNLPSVCSICNLTFDNQAALWNHMAVIHNIL